jgi:hypothetical protein
MKTLIYLLLFVGTLMIVHGIYEEKYDQLKKDVRVKYKFIPRTYYDEFLMHDNYTSKVASAMFDNIPDTRSAGLPIR